MVHMTFFLLIVQKLLVENVEEKGLDNPLKEYDIGKKFGEKYYSLKEYYYNIP
jgi:hypothetical protein